MFDHKRLITMSLAIAMLAPSSLELASFSVLANEEVIETEAEEKKITPEMIQVIAFVNVDGTLVQNTPIVKVQSNGSLNQGRDFTYKVTKLAQKIGETGTVEVTGIGDYSTTGTLSVEYKAYGWVQKGGTSLSQYPNRLNVTLEDPIFFLEQLPTKDEEISPLLQERVVVSWGNQVLTPGEDYYIEPNTFPTAFVENPVVGTLNGWPEGSHASFCVRFTEKANYRFWMGADWETPTTYDMTTHGYFGVQKATSLSLSTSNLSQNTDYTKEEGKLTLTDAGKIKVENDLTQQVKTEAPEKQKKNPTSIYSSTAKKLEPQSISYNYKDYKVEVLDLTLKKDDQNKESVLVRITAQLQLSSIIGLRLSLNPKTNPENPQSSQIEDEFEPMILNETEATSDSYVLNVKLEDVLKTGNMDSGLSRTKIEEIFNQIKDSAKIDDQSLQDFELDKEQLTKLEKIDLAQAFEVNDIGEVIEIKGTEAQKVVRPTSTGSSKPKPKPEAPTEEQPTTPVTGTPTSMYRLYNRLTGEHLYTTNKAERDELLTSDTWKDEGQGWTAPSVSDFPVYRLLNPNTGDHHYTTDKNEFDTLPSFGWVAEGIAFFSADKDQEENVILHRVYNPNAQGAGSHHYTTDKNERDSLIAQGWIDEGTAWAGLPTE